MKCEEVSLYLPSLRLPFSQARGSLRLRIRINGDLVEVLQQPNHEERRLVVGKLSNHIRCTGSVCEVGEELEKKPVLVDRGRS